MGLDASIYFVNKEDACGDFCFANHEKYLLYGEGFYFGAFWRLNDYIEKIWESKGGKEFACGDDFNNQYLRLTAKDLLDLKKTVFFVNSKQELVYEDEHTAVYKKVGFPDFFDGMDDDEAFRRQRETLEFIDKALAAIDEGREVYFWSSW